VQTHMSTIIWAMIIVPGLLALLGAWRTQHGKGAAPAAEMVQQPVRPPGDR
jgi:membrane-associated protein